MAHEESRDIAERAVPDASRDRKLSKQGFLQRPNTDSGSGQTHAQHTAVHDRRYIQRR